MRKLFSWKLRRRLGKIIVFFMILNLNSGFINRLTADPGDRDQVRAPRDGSTDMSGTCCGGIDSAELASIRLCVCSINTKIDELLVDFRDTWTILGDQSEVAVGGIDTLDEINSSTLSIMAWLKTIYAQSRGLIT